MQENVNKLMEALRADGGLVSRISGLTDLEEVVKALREAGIEVTGEEVAEAAEAFRKDTAERTDAVKVDDDELEAVAGGIRHVRCDVFWYNV